MCVFCLGISLVPLSFLLSFLLFSFPSSSTNLRVTHNTPGLTLLILTVITRDGTILYSYSVSVDTAVWDDTVLVLCICVDTALKYSFLLLVEMPDTPK